MCATLDISKRTYYKYRNAEDKDYYDYLIIKEVFDESMGTYGYRRICDGLLIKYGVIFNHKKVQRIMKKYSIKAKYTCKKKNPTYKRIEENVKPNLLNRNFNVDKPNKIWTTDITYLIFNNIMLISDKNVSKGTYSGDDVTMMMSAVRTLGPGHC